MIVEISVNEITHDGFWFVMVRKKISSISTKTFCLITHYPFAMFASRVVRCLELYCYFAVGIGVNYAVKYAM